MKNSTNEIPLNFLPESKTLIKEQINSDIPKIKSQFYEMFESDDLYTRARILASSTKEFSKWLRGIPSSQLGLSLDNNTDKIAADLRLGSQLCVKCDN